jgi:GntR family transcriptional repressor for pyruvate dehydrogenase complex
VETGSVENLVKPLATVVVGGRETLMDIFAVRKMVEPQLASLAAERATADEVLKLKNILNRQRKNVENRQLITEIDHSFHLLLAKMAKSEVFLQFYNTLAELTNQERGFSSILQHLGRAYEPDEGRVSPGGGSASKID